jgi:hypothetical protein
MAVMDLRRQLPEHQLLMLVAAAVAASVARHQLAVRAVAVLAVE